MRKEALLLIAIIFGISGCGYTTHTTLSTSGEASIFVNNFVNKIDITREVSDVQPYYSYIPAMESDITREVIDRFIFDGNYEVREERNAHFSLNGDLVGFQREPLRYDDNDNVLEYRISIIVDVALYDLKEKRTVWSEPKFAGQSTYRTSGEFAKSEPAAVQEAIQDLARRIVERTVENW